LSRHGLDIDELTRDLVDALRQRARLAEQHLIGGPERLDLLARESRAAACPRLLRPTSRAAVAEHLAVGDDVALDAG